MSFRRIPVFGINKAFEYIVKEPYGAYKFTASFYLPSMIVGGFSMVGYNMFFNEFWNKNI